jgi:hypothetical protein
LGRLDHPAPWQDVESGDRRRRFNIGAAPDPPGRSLDDLDGPSQSSLDPVFAAPAVAGVNPQMRKARQAAVLVTQDDACSVTIHDVGRMHDGAQDQSSGIDQEVAFAPIDLLTAVIAAGPPFSVVLTD